MSTKVRNTQRHIIEQQKDLGFKKVFEIEEDG